MTEIHRYVGFVVVAIFTIGWLFGLVLWISRREAGDWFWRWLVGAQVVAIVQALIGVILLIAGKRPTTTLSLRLRVRAARGLRDRHMLAREEAFRAEPWGPFAWPRSSRSACPCGRSPPASASARGIVPPGAA